ncbi:MAG: IclR family transcriptional regulator [Bacteroidetes bacterium]|nr:IclR family transcriptional regulator [Bacteroidota bacterium]
MAKPIKVVAKTFKVIEILHQGKAISLKDLAEQAMLPKPTAFRILDTLIGLGYAEHDGETQQFRLGSKFLTFIRSSTAGADVIALAKPYMEKLSETYRETINLARLTGNQIIYVSILESDQPFRISDNIGDRAAAHSTAIGKAIAAFLPEPMLKEVLATTSYTPYTRRTIVDEESLRHHLVQVRQQGYAIDDEEGHDGVLCIGAPIFNKDHVAFAALSISMPKVRAKKKVLEDITKELPRVTIQLSLALGVTDIRKCFSSVHT